MKIYYFAYGSNMNSNDLQKWCNKKEKTINLKNPKVAVLVGYELNFSNFTPSRGGAVANIVNNEDTENSEVYGVLFETDDESLENLDCKEGVQIEEGIQIGKYRRVPVGVIVDDEIIKDVVTYEIVEIKDPESRPSKEYLNIIVEGAKEHNLPEDYIEKLETIKTEGY